MIVIVVTQEWWVTTVFGNLCTCMILYAVVFGNLYYIRETYIWYITFHN